MTESSTREPENRSSAPLGGEAVRRAFERLPDALAVVAPSGGVPDGERGAARAARPSRGPVTCRAAPGAVFRRLIVLSLREGARSRAVRRAMG